MNEYFLQNSTDSPLLAEVLGLRVPAKGKSRVLTLAECQLLWANDLPVGISLVPVLLESEAPKKTNVETEETADTSKEYSRPRSSRKSKGETE